MSGVRVTHVLFDMDGLLLDTEGFYTIAQDKVFAPYPWCEYEQKKQILKEMMMGRKSLDAAKLVLDELKLTEHMTPQEFLDKRAVYLKDLLPQAELMPGAKKLLEHLHQHKVPCALATSSNRVHFKLKITKVVDLFNKVFSHMICGDDVTNGKPHPEIFLKALDLFPDTQDAKDPGKVLVFEDSPNGITAALAGGFRAIHVPDADQSEPSTPADQTLKSLEEFRPEEWGLPPFK